MLRKLVLPRCGVPTVAGRRYRDSLVWGPESLPSVLSCSPSPPEFALAPLESPEATEVPLVGESGGPVVQFGPSGPEQEAFASDSDGSSSSD